MRAILRLVNKLVNIGDDSSVENGNRFPVMLFIFQSLPRVLR